MPVICLVGVLLACPDGAHSGSVASLTPRLFSVLLINRPASVSGHDGASSRPPTPSASWNRSGRSGNTSVLVATCSPRQPIAESWRCAAPVGTN
jgi:hypothetical protein